MLYWSTLAIVVVFVYHQHFMCKGTRGWNMGFIHLRRVYAPSPRCKISSVLGGWGLLLWRVIPNWRHEYTSWHHSHFIASCITVYGFLVGMLELPGWGWQKNDWVNDCDARYTICEGIHWCLTTPRWFCRMNGCGHRPIMRHLLN